MGKGGSPPDPPDYAAQAQVQGTLDKEAAREQTFANRANQVSPWGSVNWDAGQQRDPVTGKMMPAWTQTQSLPDDMRGSFDAQTRLGRARADLGAGLFGRLRSSYGTPVNYGGFRDVTEVGDAGDVRQKAEDAAYRRSTSRLDPRFKQEREALDINLRNRGLAAGDQAYEAEMGRFGDRQTDAYQQASDAATGLGRAEAQQMFSQQQSQQGQSAALRQQEIQEKLQERGVPLSEINALLAGQGIQPPSQSTPGVTGATGYNAANMMGAAQNQYNAQTDAYNAEQAQRQGMMSGLGGLASAGIGAWGLRSDRRLKRDIHRIGTWRGRPFYSFRYIWSNAPSMGVMSDEINADAVIRVNGFDIVDYTKVRP